MKILLLILITNTLFTTNSIKNERISLQHIFLKSQEIASYELIKEAIKNKQSITCFYNGYLRKMSPHIIGTKNGRQQAFFYQYGGQSSQGISFNRDNNWRCIFIDKITNLSINDDKFETSDNHSQRQSCIDYVDIKVRN
jgi:hypothetical protein